MTARIIKHGIKAREELTVGADFLAEAVKRTLGIYGENFYLDKKNSITNDGVTVASEIHISHCVKDHTIKDCEKFGCSPEIQNRGAAAIREAATKTVEEVGDGTTTAIVLAQAIYHEAARSLSSDGVIGKKSPAEVKQQIEEQRQAVTKTLVAQATPCDTEQQLINSATVSMGDPTLGKLIGEAQWKLGKEGMILVEETAAPTSSIEYVSGIRLDNGFGTSLLLNKPDKQALDVSQVSVILTSYTMKTEQQIKAMERLLTSLASAGVREIAFIARAWTDETLQWCLRNIKDGLLKIYPLSAPYINMAQRMKDLSAVTGATYFDVEDSRLEDMIISDVGYAERIVAHRMDATVTGKDSKQMEDRVAKRVAELQAEMQGTESDFEKNHIKERIAQLSNGMAILKVGAQSALERSRLFDKADDAVHAVRAAFQEGTVEGGGVAFKKIADTLPADAILKRPLMAINQQILFSAPKGFQIAEWVRDPVKVLRISLENACSTASSFAMAGGVVTDEKQKPLDAIFRKEVANQ